MDFKEKVKELSGKINSLMTESSDKKQIDAVASIQKDLEEIVNEHNELEKKHIELKDSYIDYVKNISFEKKSEKDEIIDEDKPRTLEDIIQEHEDKKGN